MIPVPRYSGTNFKLERVNATGSRYIITHHYCLVTQVDAGFYSDAVEYLPVDPATWVQFPSGAGKTFSLYDNSNIIAAALRLEMLLHSKNSG